MPQTLQKIARKFANIINKQQGDDSPESQEVVKPWQVEGGTLPSWVQLLDQETQTNLRSSRFHLVPWETVIKLSQHDNLSPGLGQRLSRYVQLQPTQLLDDEGLEVKEPGKIARVQTVLAAQVGGLGNTGPNRDGVDGKWGSNSSKALMSWQTRNSLPVTGTMTKDTGVAMGVVV